MTFLEPGLELGIILFLVSVRGSARSPPIYLGSRPTTSRVAATLFSAFSLPLFYVGQEIFVIIQRRGEERRAKEREMGQGIDKGGKCE